MPVRLLTWNINGIRSLPRPFAEVLPALGADIVCLQETKVTRDQLDSSLVHVEGFTAFFSFCRVRGGYSGVAIYCTDRLRPLRAEDSLSATALRPAEDSTVVGCYADEAAVAAELSGDAAARLALDSEGRCLLLEFPTSDGRGLVLITVYCPNADPSNEARMQFKMRYHELLRLRCDALLRTGRHVIIAGDLNVSHRLIDHCETAEALLDDSPEGGEAGSSRSYSDALHQSFLAKPVRHWLDRLLVPRQRDPALAAHRGEGDENGDSDEASTPSANRFFIDAFRRSFPERRDAYTCWCNRTGARQTNYGNRIDYILVSDGLSDQLLNCDIQPEVTGSDHCPVLASFSDGLLLSAPPDFPLPALAAARLPEFAARQRRISDFLVPRAAVTEVQKMRQPELLASKRKQPEQTCQEQQQPAAKRRQSSLASFFASAKPAPLSLAPESGQATTAATAATTEESTVQDGDKPASNLTVPDSFGGNEAPSSAASTQLWRQLLTGPEKPPLCRGHSEACLLRTVKKDGPNRGRRFWVCPRPEGSAKNAEARCDTFLWVAKR